MVSPMAREIHIKRVLGERRGLDLVLRAETVHGGRDTVKRVAGRRRRPGGRERAYLLQGDMRPCELV